MATVAEMRARLATGDQRPEGDANATLLNDAPVGDGAKVAAGDVLRVGDSRYRVVAGVEGFLHPALIPERPARGPVRVHCGLHKCLTQYQRQVYRAVTTAQSHRLLYALRGRRTGFKHRYHYVRQAYETMRKKSIVSVSGQRLDLDSFDDIKVVRFLRDPRDLLISGYYYHKRGGEPWCKTTDPRPGDWDEVNGGLPEGLSPGQSLTDYLNAASLEDGLRAEIAFRRPHYQSMMSWDPDDPRILTLRYEDILGREAETFARIGAHFGWGRVELRAAQDTARAYAAGGKEAKRGHVRNPRPRQWRDHFSEDLNRAFVAEFGPLLRAYGYPED